MTTTNARRLVRTGDCRITLRNEAGLHLTYRVTACKDWVDNQGTTRPGTGYWIGVSAGDDWARCGKMMEDGSLRSTRNQTTDRVALYGAMVAGQALRECPDENESAEVTWYVVVNNRSYHVGLEHRCGACGMELTDLDSIRSGLGPICEERVTGVKRKRGSKRAKVSA